MEWTHLSSLCCSKSKRRKDLFSRMFLTAKLTVTYDAAKTSPAQLRTSISKLGYNADNVKADAAARAKLPSCCTSSKAGGCGHSGGCGGCGHH